MTFGIMGKVSVGTILVCGLWACGDDGAGDAADAAAATADAAPECDTPPAYTLFYNRGGGTYTPGNDDSRLNRSSIVQTERTLLAHDPAAGQWELTMACLERIWAPYAVEVTDQDPGDAPHLEIVVTASTAVDIGYPTAGGAYSLAPFSCGVIDNGIGFVFANATGADDPTLICGQGAFAAAKMFGLENVIDCPDVNAYGLCPDQDREFLDQALQCGELTASECTCTTSMTQNSAQKLRARIGPACP